MCSIEEAWAGQNFAGKPVSSQADIHNAYMHIPDDLLTRNNDFSVSNPNEPQTRENTRGVNSKYSRQPRVPNMSRNSDNASVNISSVMQPLDNYGGLNPKPSYMSIYDKSNNDPMPMMLSKDNFNNLENAFKVSDTVNRFMNTGNSNNSNHNNSNYNNSNHNNLLDDDTEEDRKIINNKFSNRSNNSNTSNTSNTSNKFTDTLSSDNIVQFQMTLQTILMKLDKLESDLHHNQSRNMYDISLYILIGMIISFMLYSILSSMKK